ncbi:MAG: endonuclease/exonuclease/phosphatase family protein [Kofleriaceae bacterium]
MLRSLAIALVIVTWIACHNTTPVTVPSLSSGPAPMPIPLRSSSSLRVMSYNLNFGVAGDRTAAAAIAGAKPQIVLLQETNEVWVQTLLADLSYAHHRFTPPKDLPAGGLGVLSRYPIVTIDELPSVGGPFLAWRVVVDTPAGRIQILNLHLRPPMSDGGSWVAGYWTTRETREQEIGWHLERLDPALPTLLAGDFNEETDGRAMKYAADRGYTDAIAQFAGTRQTWQWPVGSLMLRFQLDHIMYDARFLAVSGGIVDAGNSDHKPVWADFERVDPI